MKSISGLEARRRCTRLLVVVLAVGVLLPAAAGPAFAGAVEGCLTDKINGRRQAQGIRPLATHGDLIAIARRHSAEMAQAQRYYHNQNLTKELPSGWKYQGENVGWATDCSYMDDFFINSAPHRRNILNPTFNYIGVGVVSDQNGKLWVTEVFMQSSSGPGFAADNEPALAAPSRVSGPPPGTTKKDPSAATSVTPAARPTPAPRSAIKAAGPNPSRPGPPRAAEGASKKAPITASYRDILEKEPGFDELQAFAAEWVFDLEDPV